MKIRVGRREQYSVPKEYQQRLTRSGGLNRFNEPNFRLVWGWQSTDWLYNPKTATYHKATRYPVRPNRFYVEQWLAPERFGNPLTWDRMQRDRHNGISFDVLGPFPARGSYEMLLMLETPHRQGCEGVAVDEYEGCTSCRGGRFLQPTSWIVDQIARLVDRSRNRSERDRHNEVLEMKDSWAKNFEADADDMIKDLQPTFNSSTVFLNRDAESSR